MSAATSFRPTAGLGDALRVARIISARMERGRVIAFLLNLDADDAFEWPRPLVLADRLLAGAHDHLEPTAIDLMPSPDIDVTSHELVQRSLASTARAGRAIASEMRRLADDVEALSRPETRRSGAITMLNTRRKGR